MSAAIHSISGAASSIPAPATRMLRPRRAPSARAHRAPSGGERRVAVGVDGVKRPPNLADRMTVTEGGEGALGGMGGGRLGWRVGARARGSDVCTSNY